MVLRSQYVKEFERSYGKSGSVEKAHGEAAKKSVMPPKKKKKKKQKPDEATLLARTKRRLKELFYGPKTYSKKKFTPSLKKK